MLLMRSRKKNLDLGFGQRLQRARQRSTVSQSAFVKLLAKHGEAVTTATLSAWERGVHEPEPYRWSAISKSLSEIGQPPQNVFGESLTKVPQSGIEHDKAGGQHMIDKELWEKFGALSQRVKQLEEIITDILSERRPGGGSSHPTKARKMS